MLYTFIVYIEVAQNGGTPGKDNTVGKNFKKFPVTITVTWVIMKQMLRPLYKTGQVWSELHEIIP